MLIDRRKPEYSARGMSPSLEPPGTTTASSTVVFSTPSTTTSMQPSTGSPDFIPSPPPHMGPAHAFVKLCLLWMALHRATRLPPACQTLMNDGTFRQTQVRTNLEELLRQLNPDGTTSAAKGHDGPFLMFAPSVDGTISPKSKQELSEDVKKHYVERMPNYEREPRVKYHYRYTTRSLSVIGVLAAIVFILFVVAITTCIKNRRSILLDYYQNPGQDSFTRQILIDHLRHLSSSRRAARIEPPPQYDDVIKAEEESEEHQPPSYVEAMQRMEAADGENNGEPSPPPTPRTPRSIPGRSRRVTATTSLNNENCSLRKTSMITIQHQMAMPAITEVHEAPAPTHAAAPAPEDTSEQQHTVTVLVEGQQQEREQGQEQAKEE